MAYVLRPYRRPPASSQTILILFVLGLILPSLARAYSSTCSIDASHLEMEAHNYETAKSDFEIAQDDFKTACGPYGYSRGDESSCGQFGYTREELRSAASELDDAMNRFKSARSEVALSCDVPEEDSVFFRALSKATKENQALKKRVEQLEEDLRRLRQSQTPMKAH